MPLVTDNILAGAIERQASVVFPGNVYVYGRFQRIPATEDHPLAATGKKGKLRIVLERKLMDAHSNGKVKVVIPRFPDYYGPNVTNKLMKPIFMALYQAKRQAGSETLTFDMTSYSLKMLSQPVLCLERLQARMSKCGMSQGQGLLQVEILSIWHLRLAGNKPNIGLLSGRSIRIAGLMNSDAREMIELMYEFEEPLVLDGEQVFY